jgi:YHS domain-containing protein
MRHRHTIALLAVLAFSLVLAGPAFGAPALDLDKNGFALRGWDAVSYFEGKPLVGKAEFIQEWNGAKWRFASAAHRDAFVANPGKYAPQYGGHCAYGLAKGHLVTADPTIWKVVDGKLYVNYDKGVQKSWEKDQAQFIVDADKEWKDLADKN